MVVFPCIWVHDGGVCLAVSTGSCRSCGLYLEPRWEELCAAFAFSLSGFFSAVVLFSFFCFPPTTPPFFFLFLLFSQCNRCPDVPVWGLMAGLPGLLAMGESRGWLITVEAPGHLGHPPSTQLNGVVKEIYPALLFDNTGIYQPIIIINLTKMKTLLKEGQHSCNYIIVQ